MEATIKEIAALLRSTDEMAEQFVQRVQARVGEPVSEEEVFAAMKKVPTKSLSMDKVVTRVQQQQQINAKKASRQQTAPANPPPVKPKASANPVTTDGAVNAPNEEPKTTLGKLEVVLQENWDRADAEGLSPERMSAEAFVSAVYQYTDRREGTRRRILQAARQLDRDDVILTPALVADVAHELFEA